MEKANFTIQRVEKLLQVQNVFGRVDVRGDVILSLGNYLLRVIREGIDPAVGLTDAVLEKVTGYDKDELILPKDAIEILLILLMHPEPRLPVLSFAAQRPYADVITLWVFKEVAISIASETSLWRTFSLSKEHHIQTFFYAMQLTEAIQQLKREIEILGKERIADLSLDYLKTYQRAALDEYFFAMKYPEVVGVSVDAYLATTCVLAWAEGNEEMLSGFMKIREYLSSHRGK